MGWHSFVVVVVVVVSMLWFFLTENGEIAKQLFAVEWN